MCVFVTLSCALCKFLINHVFPIIIKAPNISSATTVNIILFDAVISIISSINFPMFSLLVSAHNASNSSVAAIVPKLIIFWHINLAQNTIYNEAHCLGCRNTFYYYKNWY